jgi:hypothetical protein
MLINDPELLLGPSMAQEALEFSYRRNAGVLQRRSQRGELGRADRDENLREVNNYLDAAALGQGTSREMAPDAAVLPARCMPRCWRTSVARRSS